MTARQAHHTALNLLGPPILEINGQPHKISSQKALAILFYVALATKPVPRNTLIGLLWPESTEQSARSNLRTQLALLRKALPNALSITRQDVAIISGEILIDAQQVLNMSEDASLLERQRYLSLWRGEFLEGFEVSGSAEFDWWLTELREHLRYKVVVAAEEAVHLAETEHQTDIQLSAARQWVTLSPLQESAHRAVMQAHLNSENRAEAIKQYKLCEQLLQAELGLEPSTETQLLYAHILEAGQTQTQESGARPQNSNIGEKQLRTMLLRKTKSFWLDSILHRNVPEKQRIDIYSEPQPELVDHPWGDVVGELLLTQGWRPDSTIGTIFSLAGQRLLITGEPGAGKSVMMLQLADHLHQKAQTSQDEPLPIILNLSTWANQQKEIGDWIEDEMLSKYGIPGTLGHDWLQQNPFVYLFDGLDEMAIKERPMAIQAMNRWLRETDPIGLVICCRLADYKAAHTKLCLQGAVRLLPLTAVQIESALTQRKTSSDLLQDLSPEAKDAFFDIASTPMMLNLIQRLPTNSYQSVEQIISQYVDESFRRKPLQKKEEKTYLQQLRYLAQNMLAHNQTIFLLEELQPSWLQSKRERLAYMLLTRMSIATLASIEYSLFAFILGIIAPDTELAIVTRMAGWLNLSTTAATFVTFWAICLAGSIINGILDFRAWERHDRTNQNSLDRLKEALISAALVAVPIGLFGNWIIGGIYALLFSSARFVAGLTWMNSTAYQDDIQADEALGWSWPQATWGALFGVVLAILVIFFFATSHLTLSFFTIVVTMILLFGMKGKRLTYSAKPNQGMRVTLSNALIGGGITGATLFAAVGLVAGWQNGLLVGLLVGLSVLYTQGLFIVLRHGVLRLLLKRSANFPLAGASFFDRVSRYSVLQKVGGGYTFRHRLILDYFKRVADTAAPPDQQ